MAKQTALGSKLWLDTYDLSGDVGAITSAETSRAVLDVSAIDQSAMDRLLARKDGTLAFSAFWNTAVGATHADLGSGQSRDDRYLTATAGTPAVGTAACSIIAKQTSYAPALGADGSLVASIGASGSGYGLEWGELLTAGAETFASGAINGASIDLGAVSSAYGAAVYIHVLSLGSGDADLMIADSANNSTWASVIGTTFTMAMPYRMETAPLTTIRRYVRLQVSGTYTALVCVVNFVRYTASPA